MDNPINYWYQKYLQEKQKNEGMIEALRTEYEKGRADVLDKAFKWVKNYFKGVPGGSVYIEDFKQAVKE